MPQSSSTDPDRKSASSTTSFWNSPAGRWTLVSLTAAAAVIGIEYRAAILSSSAIFWLPVFLCLGMHLFMHRGHGANDRSGGGDKR